MCLANRQSDSLALLRLQVQAVLITGKPWMPHLTWGMHKDRQVNGKAVQPRLMTERATGGLHSWQWLAADPARDKIFNDGMAEIDNNGEPGLALQCLECCRWTLIEIFWGEAVSPSPYSLRKV